MAGTKYEKPETYVIPVVMQLLSLKFRAELAALLGVDSSYLTQLVKEPHGRFSNERLEQICGFLRDNIVPSIDLSPADLNLPKEEFIDCIPKEHPRYAAARAAAGLPIEELSTFTRRQLLFGNYVRLFVARDDKNPKRSEVVLENFVIEAHPRGEETRIIQLDYEWEDRKPFGNVRVRGEDTIEIRIDYDHPRDPMGFFLAQFPSGVTVRYILAMALDIKYNSRFVVTRPVLFVRVSEGFKKKDRFGPKTRLFKSVHSLFKNSVIFDATKFEVVPSSVREEDFAEVLSALDGIRKESGR